MIFSVRLSESTSCLHSIKQFWPVCVASDWCVKLDCFCSHIFLRREIWVGFFFLASWGTQTVSCFCGLESNGALHMKEHTAGCYRLICSFLLVFYAICIFVYVSACCGECKACCLWWIATAVETNLDVEERWFCSEICAASLLCVTMKNWAHISQRRSATVANEKHKKQAGRQGSGPWYIHCVFVVAAWHGGWVQLQPTTLGTLCPQYRSFSVEEGLL